MRLDSIIRILDSKEYGRIDFERDKGLKWYDVYLDDGGVIRLECFEGIEENGYGIIYFTNEGVKIFEKVEIDYRKNGYYIFKSLYNDIKRLYEGVR